VANRKKERDVCKAYDCLVITCSRHRCQFKRDNRLNLNWVDGKEGCKMYKSRDQWRTFYTPPPRDEEFLGMCDCCIDFSGYDEDSSTCRGCLDIYSVMEVDENKDDK
jgi:hypothetical protein